jgi:septum site-determining protein MinC
MGPLWVKDLCRFFQIPYLKNSFTTQDDNEQYSHYKEGFALSLSVRPGQQYMRQGDLILLAPIHYGAEVLATGHIHAYARAQGRLLAGINGNQSAQIFCTSLQAELLSIAGVFLTKDLYPKKCLNQACRIFLDQKTQQLIFHPIS